MTCKQLPKTDYKRHKTVAFCGFVNIQGSICKIVASGFDSNFFAKPDSDSNFDSFFQLRRMTEVNFEVTFEHPLPFMDRSELNFLQVLARKDSLAKTISGRISVKNTSVLKSACVSAAFQVEMKEEA